MILEILTAGIPEIAGYSSGGGSLFLALLALIIKLIRVRIKNQRYQRVKESLKMIETKIKTENESGVESLKEKLGQVASQLSQVANDL